jgi:hypothetical protein
VRRLWRSRHPDRVTRRLRFLLLGAGILELLVALWAFWTSSLSFGVRAWLSGYEGCMCEDCRANHIGVDSSPFRWTPLPFGYGADREDLAVRFGWAGVLTCGCALFVRWIPIPRRREAFRCSGCGYDLRGLPGPLCPECGNPFRGIRYPLDSRPADRGQDSGNDHHTS